MSRGRWDCRKCGIRCRQRFRDDLWELYCPQCGDVKCRSNYGFEMTSEGVEEMEEESTCPPKR